MLKASPPPPLPPLRVYAEEMMENCDHSVYTHNVLHMHMCAEYEL